MNYWDYLLTATILFMKTFCGLMESPPRLGLGTILGPLDQSLTHMNPRTRIWVQSLGTAWKGVRHPRPPDLWAGLHYVRPYLIKEFIKRALILNLNIHHAVWEITHTTC